MVLFLPSTLLFIVVGFAVSIQSPESALENEVETDFERPSTPRDQLSINNESPSYSTAAETDESITFTTDKPTIIHHHKKPTSNYVNVTRSRHDQLRIFLSAIEPRVPNGLSSSAPSKTSSATTKFELLLVKHLGILLFLILFSVVKLSFLMSFAVFGLGLGIFGTALKVGLVIFGPIIKLSLLITSPILRLFYANLKTFYNLYISSELLGPLMQIEMDVIGPLVTLIKNNTIQWLKFEAQFFLPPLLELWQKLLKV